ncbi:MULTISPECIES: gp16 family protein [unclassified Marinovum]|uniref:gp16 family protein n=1 Tax=unclassified Marinovum TaxID=2647166 RepID=UPI003EDBBBC9
MTAEKSLQKMIHVGCKQLGIDNETRRDLQFRVTGKASMSGMSEADLRRVVAALKQQGFKPFGNSYRGHRRDKGKPAAPRSDLRYVHVLWRLLGQAGVVTRPGRDGLNAFIRARYEGKWEFVPIDVDALRDPSQISDVIRALKDWCRRAGVRTEQ